MKRLIIKNKRKIWCWFLLIIFLILACRAAYVTGNGAGQTRDDEVKEEQVKNEAIQVKWRNYAESIFKNRASSGKRGNE